MSGPRRAIFPDFLGKQLRALNSDRRQTLRDALAALSLANLALLPVWEWGLDPDHLYFLSGPRPVKYLWVALLNVLFLGAVIFGLLRQSRASDAGIRSHLAAWGIIGIGLFTVNYLRVSAGFSNAGAIVKDLGIIGIVITVSLVAMGLLVVARNARRVVPGIVLACLIFVPFLGFTVFRTVYDTVRGGSGSRAALANVTTAPLLEPSVSGLRVVWMIFDELDADLAFDARPKSLELPAFDRVRARSVVFDRAISPSLETFTSIPALLTGIPRDTATGDPTASVWGGSVNRDEANGANVPFTVFARARTLGVNSAVVGWYHPYCRVLGRSLGFCAWRSYVHPEWQGGSIGELLRAQARVVAQTVPGVYRLLNPPGLDLAFFDEEYTRVINPETPRAAHLQQYRELISISEEVVADDTFGLVFIHLPIPHRPIIYDRRLGQYDITGHGQDYFDNLALADLALGRLMRRLDAGPTGNRTVVLVSSDHPYRGSIPEDAATPPARGVTGQGTRRVPLLVAWPVGPEDSVIVRERFQAVRTQDIVLGILGGSITSRQELVEAVQRRRGNLPLEPAPLAGSPGRAGAVDSVTQTGG